MAKENLSRIKKNEGVELKITGRKCRVCGASTGVNYFYCPKHHQDKDSELEDNRIAV